MRGKTERKPPNTDQKRKRFCQTSRANWVQGLRGRGSKFSSALKAAGDKSRSTTYCSVWGFMRKNERRMSITSKARNRQHQVMRPA